MIKSSAMKTASKSNYKAKGPGSMLSGSKSFANHRAHGPNSMMKSGPEKIARQVKPTTIRGC